MPIINGKRFFEYIDYYIQLKENLFKNNTFKEFYEKYCNYPYSKRSGDSRVKNLYENILLQFLDRFGYIEDFEDFYKAFYKEIYIIRCEKMKVLEETILKSEVIKIFAEIKETLNTDRLKYYHYKKYKITDSEFAKGIGHIVDFIDDSFINKINSSPLFFANIRIFYYISKSFATLCRFYLYNISINKGYYTLYSPLCFTSFGIPPALMK